MKISLALAVPIAAPAERRIVNNAHQCSTGGDASTCTEDNLYNCIGVDIVDDNGCQGHYSPSASVYRQHSIHSRNATLFHPA
jgi:hypothetical protein